MRSYTVRCPSCDYRLLRLEGQKAVQVDPAPPSAPTFAVGVVDVAADSTPSNPAEGRAQLLIDTLASMVRRAAAEVPDRRFRLALETDLEAALREGS